MVVDSNGSRKNMGVLSTRALNTSLVPEEITPLHYVRDLSTSSVSLKRWTFVFVQLIFYKFTNFILLLENLFAIFSDNRNFSFIHVKMLPESEIRNRS